MKSLIQVQDLCTAYGDRLIHDRISFDVYEGEIFGILGGSGSGKSTLLRSMILLNRPKSGRILIFDEDIWQLKDPSTLLTRCGVLFQFGALFSSLNVLENVGILLEEYSAYPQSSITEVAKYLLDRVGLSPKAYHLYPHELSGGMKKRVGLARALALNPRILFLDEPSSGLDPASAQQLDELICALRLEFTMTIVMITHDLDSIKDTTDRFLMLKDGKIEFLGNLSELAHNVHTLDSSNLFFSKRGERLWREM
ncbi:ABC transporter ATP-binding protein [Helicobacter canis]|uniref:ATP-binding cassette domain-containing protein n=1 Tax=Helicobacter canis TaxID=29419 RepID=A0A5M9QSK4_9HELI|nr:ATP-binding cassette domain-containing protein [Helicobacter canis]KAA8710722.1 ATP-binding cassette domain-containing protein [Helicobacter canis]